MRLSKDNPAKFLNKVLPFVETDGARNFNAICRKLSMPYQTVRFRMDRFREQGLSIIPIVDVEKLGLQRVRAKFQFPKDVENPKVILGGLHQKGGLTYYSKCLLNREIICEFLLPNGSLSEFQKLLTAMEEMRLIQNAKFDQVLWKQVLMMRTSHFDYPSGNWDVDFSNLDSDPSIKVPKTSVPENKIDYTDLLIIKHLEEDPWIKVVDIAKKLKLDVGDTSYHLNRHVFGRRLISSFGLRWIGTKEAWMKHSVVGQTFTFEKVSDSEARHAMSVVTSIPFIWNHLRMENGTYAAELLIPVNHFPETQAYLSEMLSRVDLVPEVTTMDWSFSSRFTIPHTLFEGKSGWGLKAETSLGYVLQMIKEYGR